ncbi:cobalt/nickel transport system permease protein [Methanolobus vulcani]|uniref:Cobalt/nickel transport system permease protein n=1 Tax=Methanolobus vulcani TaxID=38026 RepID=A0A7Z7AW22_9EURY|nr:cobalt ECF transporter T component CbiQ [Methanolobus vulcani]SDF46463.1 cobalt/nickel transport system permease protein [Methanolobus vulcani]
MTHVLDDYALNSPLREKNNWLKLAITIFGILVGVSSNSPVPPFVIALCMGIATVHFSKVPVIFYLKILAAPAGFVLVSSVIIAFLSGSGTELFGFDILGHRLGVDTAGLNLAILVLARTISGMSCMFFLSLTTPMIELFSVLKAAKLPDSFVEIAMMMYRYIFVFLDVAMDIKYAQTVRLGYRDFKTSFRSMVMLGANLFIRSWEQGEKLYLSMNSRCYDGKLIMYDEKRPVKMPDILLTGIYFVIVLSVFSLTRDMSFI